VNFWNAISRTAVVAPEFAGKIENAMLSNAGTPRNEPVKGEGSKINSVGDRRKYEKNRHWIRTDDAWKKYKAVDEKKRSNAVINSNALKKYEPVDEKNRSNAVINSTFDELDSDETDKCLVWEDRGGDCYYHRLAGSSMCVFNDYSMALDTSKIRVSRGAFMLSFVRVLIVAIVS